MPIKVFPKGYLLIRRGDTAAAFYIVKEGVLGIFNANGDLIYRVEPGMLTGEAALFRLIGKAEERTADVEVLTDATVEELTPEDAVTAALNGDPTYLVLALQALLSHTATNFDHLETYAKEHPNRQFLNFFLAGFQPLVGQSIVKSIELHHREFKDVLVLLFHLRNFSRETCESYKL